MDLDGLINQITSLQIAADSIERAIERSGDPGGALKLVDDALRGMINALKSLLEHGPEGNDWQPKRQASQEAPWGEPEEPAEPPADDAAGPGVDIVVGAIGHLVGGIIGGILGSGPAGAGNADPEPEFPGRWVDGSHYKVGDQCYRVEWLAIDEMIKARVRPVPCADVHG